MTIDELLLMEAALKAAKSPGAGRYGGLCWHAGEAFRRAGYPVGVSQSWLEAMFQKWPGFSGTICFPVPHPTMSPSVAYAQLNDLYVGEYGKNREDLRQFLLAEAYKQRVQSRLLEALEEVLGMPKRGDGICSMVVCSMEGDGGTPKGWYLMLRDAYTEWPEFSGDHIAPVPSFIEGRDAHTCFCMCEGGDSMWDAAEPYGAARWRLLHFLIDYFRKVVHDAA